MTPERVRVRVRVTGRVQGVCFRASAVDEAERLGISGFARNLADGSVEVEAEGERRSVEAMVVWCRHGPRWARVEQAAVEWLVAKRDGGAFHIAS